MVGVAATMVAHRRTDILGYHRELLEQGLGTARLETHVALQGGVEFVDIGLVMLAMMDLHGTRVDKGFERVIGVW